MSRAHVPLHKPLLAALALTAAVGLAGLAQPPGDPPADKRGEKKAGPKEGQTKYQAQLISVRPDADRVVFRVHKDGSQRIYSLLLAEQATVRADGQDAGLGALTPDDVVTVTTARRGGLERVVAIAAGDPGAGPRPKGPADRDGEPTGGNVSLAFPTGDRATSVLLIETNAPDEVRVGEAYDYRIKVTNISKNLLLESVVVRQVASDKLDVRAAGGRPSGKANKDGGAKDGKSPDGKGDAGGQQPDRGTDDGEGNVRWTVPALAPGETATLRAPAVAHAEGTVGSCFRVTYQPALCVRVRAVKPALRLTKSAPPEVRLCEPLAFKYTVTNTGSAAARGVVITDDLPDGLTSDQKDQNRARFEVGDLKPGESKEFTAPVLAAGRGEYASRAAANTAGGLSVQSKPTTTKVREAELTVGLSGPESGYVQQSATYTVKVTNDGDAPAPGSRLEVRLDPNARFVRAGRVTRPGAPGGDQNQPGKGKDAAPPTPDKDGKLAWDLGTLRPGETRQATFTVTGRQQGAIKTVAVARFACARAKDSEDLAVARKAVQTEMLVVPALRLSLVDQSDLIRVGDTVTYTVRVTNQGTGPDKKVVVKLRLPEELEYVDAVGPSNGKADDKGVVTLDGVDQLAPGQTLTWNVRAKAGKEGDVRTTAELDSEYLESPVTTTEPTRLVK